MRVLRSCLFVCLFHGVPEVRGGRRLTKDGPYATRRQAEAVLFVRRKPTPPFAGCQGNLLFRDSRGIIVPTPLGMLGCWLRSFGTTNPCAPVHPKWSAYQVYQVLLGNTPWRCAHPLALSRRDVFQSMPCHRCVPSMYMCCLSIQSFVLLAITNPRSFGSVCRLCFVLFCFVCLATLGVPVVA